MGVAKKITSTSRKVVLYGIVLIIGGYIKNKVKC